MHITFATMKTKVKYRVEFGSEYVASGVKRTHDEFVKLFKKSNAASNDIEIVGQYKTNTTPIACVCRVCGYRWSPTPKSLLTNHGCPKCARNIRLSHEEFVNLLKTHNPNAASIELLGSYQSMSQKIKCRCSVCSYEWNARCGDLIYSKSGCPRCSGNINFSHTRFVMDVQSHNPHAKDIEFLSTYIGSTKRVNCKCRICGHEWSPLASSLRQGTGCPECAKKSLAITSREQLKSLPKQTPDSHSTFLAKFQEKNPHSNQIEIIGQYTGSRQQIRCKCKKCNTEWEPTAASLLSGTGCPKCSHSSTSFMEQFVATALKFALNECNVILRDKKTIGKELDILIPEHNVAIEIGSWKWHKRTYENDLRKQDLCRQKGIRLFIIYDLCTDVLPPQKDVYCYSFDLGSESKHQTLRIIIDMLLGQIGVQRTFNKTEWEEITKLSYENSQRIDHDRFIDKFKKNNASSDTIEILSKYTRAIDPIKCRCTVCHHTWKTTATELIRGSGCPKCKIAGVACRKSKRYLIKEWKIKNPNGSKLRCEKETGISRMTVYKWWNDPD